MTGPEFALSVVASMIAAVLYDMLRNPPPPVFKNESKNLLRDGQKLIRKFASKVLPYKKEGSLRPTALLSKKSEPLHVQSVNSCSLNTFMPTAV